MSGSVGQYTKTFFPFAASKANTTFATRTNDSAMLAMGYLEGTQAQNSEVTWDDWFDSVTWKYAQVALHYTDSGIATIQLDGVTQGTIDEYNAVLTRNVYSEITGLVVATPGVKTFKILMATKNASSSGYGPRQASAAWVRTGGTPSTPNGTDTPGYTVEDIPWMGVKSTGVGGYGPGQYSSLLGGGNFNAGGGVQNQFWTRDNWIDTGTFSLIAIFRATNTNGIASYQHDGSTIATVDQYASPTTDNTVSTTTGISVGTAGVKNLKELMATKNASATSYDTGIQSIKRIRTGA